MMTPDRAAMRRWQRWPWRVGRSCVAGWLVRWWLLASAAVATPTLAVDLQNVEFAALPGNRVEVQLTFSGPVTAPPTFATESPARIALDFEGATSKVDRKAIPVGVGPVHSLIAVEASNRTRVVVNLTDSVPYQVKADGNKVTLKINTQNDSAGQPTLSTPAPTPSPTQPPTPAGQPPAPATGQTTGQTSGQRPLFASPPAVTQRAAGGGGAVRDIDFRRGEGGEGRVLIRLPSPDTRVAVREQAGHVFVDLYNSSLPKRLFRRLEVADFATPVTAIESKQSGRNIALDIQAAGDYDYMAYQTDDLFTLDFRKLTPAEKDQAEKKKIVYSGDRLSLNFQDIEVRAVLQLLADFTGLNLVASDTVAGKITLRLKNVPWDQALDIILKSKGLAMRQSGNVIMVAPSQELAAQEKLELESQKQIEELAPVRTEFIQINYAKAADLATMLKSEKSNLLSKDRGNVTVDARTNTLLIQDTTAKLEDIRKLITRLDIPVRQVMIESRIVIANNDFARDLGVRFGYSKLATSVAGNYSGVTGGKYGSSANPLTGRIDPYQSSITEGQSNSLSGNSSGVSSNGNNSSFDAANNSSNNAFVSPPGSSSTSSNSASNSSSNSAASAFANDIANGFTNSAATTNAIAQQYRYPQNLIGATLPLLVNLPAANPSGAINFLIGRVGSYLLQLELSAMQTEGRGEIISSPRVITSDTKKATIKVGQQIPYQQQTGGTTGGTNIAFKDAMLQLDVTPQITPDDRIIMDLKVNKDNPGTAQSGQPPPIQTRSVETTVLVDNGETVILGGVYETDKEYSKNQVPWLGDVPMLGRLFKQDSRKDSKSELLIFVTPKILKGGMDRE